ncbi:hypothetical protein LptCag_1221 [Leptospirillum ferriphilum]|uniref:Uncharacterized protein n=1 Tax=Leptospirillum ferriphilum TaxID=178606 RepID=A0A094WA85_9BACT|nr:hypothetical protein LptCag_1221 [Leptospirillum ferriphilum]
MTVPGFRFPDDRREEVKKLLGGDERKVIILEDELAPRQVFTRNMTEIGPYCFTLGEGRARNEWYGESGTEEKRENRKVLAQVEKLKKELQKTSESVKNWSWYKKVSEHWKQNQIDDPAPLDSALCRINQDVSFLEGLVHHYSGRERDLRTEEEKKHVLAVVLSLFPGHLPVDGCPRKERHPMPTAPYRLAEIVMEELGIEPGDFRRLYTPAANRLNKIRDLK